MTVERFDLNRIAPQPWKNGAGLTREIASGGDGGAGFDWRISVAEVERDAPFSAFPGIDRCIVLLHGGGMHLRSGDGRIDHALTQPLRPFRFPGEVALQATLAGGASSDFNLMTRRGAWRGDVRCEHGTAELQGGDISMLFCVAGDWLVGTEAPLLLGASQALLWRAPQQSIAIRTARPAPAATLLVVRLCHDRGA